MEEHPSIKRSVYCRVNNVLRMYDRITVSVTIHAKMIPVLILVGFSLKELKWIRRLLR